MIKYQELNLDIVRRASWHMANEFAGMRKNRFVSCRTIPPRTVPGAQQLPESILRLSMNLQTLI
eukprot:3459658-Pleurochrysis_carterae.AAC.2